MKEKILIADDNLYLVEILKTDLELLNYAIAVARDGEEALKKIEELKPDLIILDVMMPKLNGYQVCRKIKNSPELKDIVVIMLTAKATHDDKYWGMDCGADEYVTKPFDTDQLEELIKKKLDEKNKGKVIHPITGLTMLPHFKSELLKRYKKGVEFSQLTYSFKDDGLESLESILGKFWIQDALKNTASTLKKFVANLQHFEPFLGFSGDNSFLVLINADKEQALDFANQCLKYLNVSLSHLNYKKPDSSAATKDPIPVLILGCAIDRYNSKDIKK
jgi:DNA-binding response OmpR family regulator